jgi:protein TonB
MPVHTENSVAPPERRLHVRQRLDDIVYLDVGAGNGGIVLNLSEKGMGFQAVGPLDKKGELRLRIKLPGSKTRIDVTAQIAWISDTQRQAGVRFSDAQSEGSVQIQEWIRLQFPPSAPCEESSRQGEEVSVFQKNQETILELPTDERLSVTSDSESSDLSQQKPAEIGGGETHPRVPPAREDPVISQEPESVSQPLAEPAKSPLVWRAAMHEESSQTAAFQTPDAIARVEPDGGDAPIAAPSYDEPRGDSTVDWTRPISRAASIAMPPLRDAPFKLPETIAPDVESKTNTTTAPLNTVVAVPAATDSMLVWNRAAFAVFFALCTIICFGIGTWVGQVVTRRNSSNAAAAAAPVNALPTAEPGINGSTESNAGRPARVTAEKVRTVPASGHSAHENRKIASSTSSPDVLPTPQNTASSHSALENRKITPSTSSPDVLPTPQSTGSSHSALENRKIAPSMSTPNVLPVPQNTPSNPPEQTLTTLAPAKEQVSNPPVAPALVAPVAAASSPRIVSGLLLKPSDRFNPCYLTYRVEAAYPQEAREQRIEGVVKIQQVIGTDGSVRSVKLLSGQAILASAALEAAKYWRYLPALLNGQAVETEQDVQIEFRLPQ